MHCSGKEKSTLSYRSPNGTDRTVILPAGIEVDIVRETTLINCWRFYGIGIYGQPIECWASGVNPSWGAPINGGNYHPYMNGEALYRSIATMQFESYSGIEARTSYQTTPGTWTFGQCGTFGTGNTDTCRILVNGGDLLNDVILCPGNYQVSCDDECPPGYCKCPSDKYPGYCCLDCKAVASRINSLAARANCG